MGLLTRIQYYKTIRDYQEQADYYNISNNYINIGTLFDEKKYKTSRDSLISELGEMLNMMQQKKDILDSSEEIGTIGKKEHDNIEKMRARIISLVDKVRSGKPITREDYSKTYVGFIELLLFKVLNYGKC